MREYEQDATTSDEVFEGELYEYIITHHRDELVEILRIPEEEVLRYFPVPIDYVHLSAECPRITVKLLWFPDKILSLCDKALSRAIYDVYKSFEDDPSKSLLSIKKAHLRIHSLPDDGLDRYMAVFPGCEEEGTFMTIVGNVTKITSKAVLECKRQYRCNKCKQVTTLESSRNQYNSFPKYSPCPSKCKGGRLEVVDTKISGQDYYRVKDYQEIKVQEQTKGDFSLMPKSMWVILEDDLVESCKPGDDVLITGTLFLRSRPFRPNCTIESELAFVANHIQVKNDRRMYVKLGDKIVTSFKQFWKQNENNPFEGRNVILKSFCPQIYGMYLVKLAMTVVLAGGVSKHEAGTNVRGEAHLLIVGDPGTGKSQLLKFASKVMPRSVFTTGTGSTNAGLTVTAVKENGQWCLEAGALVLADGGVCCIDEFSTVKEHDRSSILEAMEQQTISTAKAGLVSTLHTKCTIIAATNPKFEKYDVDANVDVNVGLPSPLLSRFDLVLVLKDAENDAWDALLCDFILSGTNVFELAAKGAIESGTIWDAEMLQAYMVFIKEIDPVMTDEAQMVLANYYKLQRNSTTRNAARTTVRLYESLFRLSEAHARLMFRQEVLVHDAVIAVSLIEASMQSSAIIGQHPNSLHIPFPEDAFQEYSSQAEQVLKALGLEHIWRKESTHLTNLRRNQKKPAPPPPQPPSSQLPRSSRSNQSQLQARSQQNPSNQREDVFKIPEVPVVSTEKESEPKVFNPEEFFRNDEENDNGDEVCSCRVTSTQIHNPPNAGIADGMNESLSPIRCANEDSENVMCTPSLVAESFKRKRMSDAEFDNFLHGKNQQHDNRNSGAGEKSKEVGKTRSSSSELEPVAVSVNQNTGPGKQQSYRNLLDRFRREDD